MDTITSQPVTLRHSSLNRTGLPNILEKFLPKHHTSLQGMKLQIVFNKQVLLSYFLDRQSESPGLSAFFPQGLAIKKNEGILIFSHTSRLLETPASLWVALFHRYTRSRKKASLSQTDQKLLLMSHLPPFNTNQTRHCPSSCEPV